MARSSLAESIMTRDRRAADDWWHSLTLFQRSLWLSKTPEGTQEAAWTLFNQPRYELESRPPHYGGGWHVRFFEGGHDVGGTVIPAQEDKTPQETYDEAREIGREWQATRWVPA
jgi:hypothetical protein